MLPYKTIKLIKRDNILENRNSKMHNYTHQNTTPNLNGNPSNASQIAGGGWSKIREADVNLLQEAKRIMSSNRISHSKLGDFDIANVWDMSELVHLGNTPSTSATHRFDNYAEGDVETLILMNPTDNLALSWIDFEFTDLTAEDSVTIKPLLIANLSSSNGAHLKDPYLYEEYDLSKINEITVFTEDPLTINDTYRHHWYLDKDFFDIGKIILAFQNWSFL